MDYSTGVAFFRLGRVRTHFRRFVVAPLLWWAGEAPQASTDAQSARERGRADAINAAKDGARVWSCGDGNDACCTDGGRVRRSQAGRAVAGAVDRGGRSSGLLGCAGHVGYYLYVARADAATRRGPRSTSGTAHRSPCQRLLGL